MPHLAILIKENYKKIVLCLLFIVLLLVFVYQLVKISWLFSATSSMPKLPSPTVANIKKDKDLRVLTMDLFEKYVPLAKDIKKTTLKVRLAGILYSSNPQKSQAIILLEDGKEQNFIIGDKLPQGAEIKQIHEKEVLILYNGTLESLTLIQDELRFVKPAKPFMEE